MAGSAAARPRSAEDREALVPVRGGRAHLLAWQVARSSVWRWHVTVPSLVAGPRSCLGVCAE